MPPHVAQGRELILNIQGVPHNFGQASLKEWWNENEINGTWLSGVLSSSKHLFYVFHFANMLSIFNKLSKCWRKGRSCSYKVVDIALKNIQFSCFQHAACCIVLFSAFQRKPAKFNGWGVSPLMWHDKNVLNCALAARSAKRLCGLVVVAATGGKHW